MSPAKTNCVNRVFHDLNKMNEHLPFTVERFTKFSKTHQGMLFPAFQLQLHLQEKVCGVAFWAHCSNRRIELSKGKFVTMGELMEVVRYYLRFTLHKKLKCYILCHSMFVRTCMTNLSAMARCTVRECKVEHKLS